MMSRTKWIAVLIAAVSMLALIFGWIQNAGEPTDMAAVLPQASVLVPASIPASPEELQAEPSVLPATEPAPTVIPSSEPQQEPTPEPAPSVALPAKPVEIVVSIPVLNYHSVGTATYSSLILDPVKLDKQLGYLAKEGYTPLSIDDFTLILEKRKPAPPKPVLLTFDDGYSDNYTLAMPLLRRYHFPAVTFISPGMVGTPGYMTWEQVKELHKSSWDILPHGMTHPHLPLLSAAKQKEQIVESRRLIEKQLGTKADVFCYPYGEYNKDTLAILKEAGFRYAFTIQQGRTTSLQAPYELKRIYVNGRDTLEAWIKKLLAK